MDYAEYPAPAALARHFVCAWSLHSDAPQIDLQTIFPDGRCELIAHFGAAACRQHPGGRLEPQSQTLFAAQQRGPIRLQASGALHCLGLRLQPAASALLLDHSLAALRDQIVDLDQLAPELTLPFRTAARALIDRADATPIWNWAQTLAARFEIDANIEDCVRSIDIDPQQRITGLAAQAGCSLRSLQTRFLAQVGVTAKEYARLRRVQLTLRTLDGSVDSIASVAADVGFTDQAHATRELRRLTGHTPARLWHALQHDRHDDLTLRMAAAFVRGHAGR